jgi:hypothetical protein
MTAGAADPRSLVIASGGARGITARCVIVLARRYGWRFLLLGRTRVDGPLPAWAGAISDEAEVKRRLADDLAIESQSVRPVDIQRRYDALRARLEIEETLAAVTAGGGFAEYLAVDVAEAGLRDHLAPAIARHGGAVSGIIHGAGALADRRLEHKRGADFDRVFAPKARGLRALLDAVDCEALRFVVLFSSAAGYYGHAGQADYALANEVLNKVAYRLRADLPQCRVIAFDWGPWGGGAGMVTPSLQERFEARGVGLIPPEIGTRIVADALSPDATPATQVLVGPPLPVPAPPPASAGRAHRIVRRLHEASSPFLRDHVIGGRPVLPLTCAMAWIADACESRYPGRHAIRLEECRVLSGVVLDDGEAQDLTIELTEIARAPGAGDVRVRAEVTGRGTGSRPRPHYRAEVLLAPEQPEPPPLDRASLAAATADAADGSHLYEDGTLFHGPAFRGVRRVITLDERGLTLECELPPVPGHVQGQFRAGTVNPYVSDALFQALLVWARRSHGAASLPLCAARADLYRPLEFDRPYVVSVTVRERSLHRIVADLTAAADDGVHLQLTRAEVAMSPTLAPLFAVAGTA